MSSPGSKAGRGFVYVGSSLQRPGVAKVGATQRDPRARIDEYSKRHLLEDQWSVHGHRECDFPEKVEAVFAYLHRKYQITLSSGARELYLINPDEALRALDDIIIKGTDAFDIPDRIKQRPDSKVAVDYEGEWRKVRERFYAVLNLPSSERTIIHDPCGTMVLFDGGLGVGLIGIFRPHDEAVPELDQAREAPHKPEYYPVNQFISGVLIRLVGMGKEVHPPARNVTPMGASD